MGDLPWMVRNVGDPLVRLLVIMLVFYSLGLLGRLIMRTHKERKRDRR